MSYINKKLEDFNNYIREKKVAVIGLGVSNKPLLDYLYINGAIVTAFDKRSLDKIDTDIINKLTEYSFEMSIGDNYLQKLDGFDVIFRSPSCRPDIPEIEKEVARGAKLTSEIEMLMELCPCKVVAITGSDGKTTTTSLVYEILKQKYNCFLGGNIGFPLFTKLNEMKPEDIIVLELSSFQLMTMKKSPDIAIITNISPNHLDIHKSYEEYIESKTNIFKGQNENGLLVLNYDNDITKDFKKQANGKVIYFSSKTKLSDGVIYDDGIIKSCDNDLRRHIIATKNTNLRGIHNAENICAAIAATSTLVDIETQVNAITNFKGVKHRLEFIRELDGIKWYNDSIGTSPTRTIAGLKAFDEKIVLIAGGYDKHLDYEPIAKPIVDNVNTLIIMGQTSEKIRGVVQEELKKQNKEMKIIKVSSLEESVDIARQEVKPGEIVLFSPASASFDMFKNFEERGDKFKEIVNSK